MGFILDYISWRGDLSFDVDKVNEIDMVALSFVPLLDLEGIAPKLNSEETITLKELMTKYNVRSIPTLVVIENGKEINRSVGLIPEDKILALIGK